MDEYIDVMESTNETSLIFVALVSILLAVLTYIISPIILRRVLKYASTENLDFNKKTFIKNSRLALSSSFIVLGFSIIAEETEIIFSIENVTLSVLLTIILLLWLRVGHNIGKYIIQKIVKKRYDKSIIPIIENVWTLIILLMMVFLTFDIWSIDITPLLASAGVAGIVLGLAARETISNFFGSVALYADNTYQTGHFIELNNGEFRGFVHDISIRSTQLVTLEGNKVIVPNSKLHNSIIENKSTPKPDHRIELEVGVSYDSTPGEAEEAIRRGIERVIEEEEDYERSWFFGNAQDSYRLFLKDFGDSAIIFKIFLKIKAPQQENPLRSKFYHTIYEELDKDNIGIPYPQRSIHFAEDKKIEGFDDGSEYNELDSDQSEEDTQE